MLPTSVGLLLAMGGVALLASPAGRLLGDPDALRTRVLEQLSLWLLLGAVLSIVLFWEHRPFSSIGLRSNALWSIGRAAVLAGLVVSVVSPLALRAVAATGLPTIEAGAARFDALPLWLKLFSLVTAGIVEETLFRGYALERLAELLGHVWLAAAITWIVFAAVHGPAWGAGGVLVILCTSAVFTLFYVWQRDLAANVLAHVAVDGVGLLIVPALQRPS